MQHAELVDYYAHRFTKLCLGEEVPTLRPTYGDRIDVGAARMVIASMLAYSPEVRLWFYEVGKRVGLALASKLKERGILSQFLAGQVGNPLGEFSSKPVADGGFIVRVSGNLFAEGLPNVGVKFDRILAGILASLVSSETGRRMGAVEQDCYANGGSACEFLIEPTESPAATALKGAEPQNWENAMDRIVREYVKRESSTKGRRKLRQSLDDQVDVVVLRLLMAALLAFYPEARSWMYATGKRAGILEVEQEIKSLKGRMASIMLPLVLMLRGRVTFRDEGGMVGMERKGKNVIHFTIYECPGDYGVPIMNESIGYFTAGNVAGRFEKYTGKPMGAKEIKCAAKGDPYCVYEVKPLA